MKNGENKHPKDSSKPSTNSDSKEKPRSELTHYSSVAFKMGAIIFLGIWGGMKLDEYFNTPRPYVTIVTSLLSVALAIYVVIKDLIR